MMHLEDYWSSLSQTPRRMIQRASAGRFNGMQ
jgi:hypothetical protein